MSSAPNSFHLISSDQLDLYCLTERELATKILENRSFGNPHQVFTDEELPRANRLADVKVHPDNIRWYYRMIVDRERNIAVGTISFHAPPDSRGMLEIGLGIAEEERGKGYAQEALAAMWGWAIRQENVRFLRYTVSPANAPSMAIIRNFGFPLIGEQIDEEDGLELIYEISAQQFQVR